MKKYLLGVGILLGLISLGLASSCCEGEHANIKNKVTQNAAVIFNVDKKTKLTEEYTVNFNFKNKPSLGTNVLIASVYNNKGEKQTNLKLEGVVDMPEMRGAHIQGIQKFNVNKKSRDYLLPVSFVMPGKWEIAVKAYNGKKLLREGVVNVAI